MLRWYIIRTLLYKEVLRYRYNWGLLVMVAALLALAGLISISARKEKLPGQEELAINKCDIYFRPNSRDAAWAEYLHEHPPSFKCTVRFLETEPSADSPRLNSETMAVELQAPSARPGTAAAPAEEVWKVRYWRVDKSEVPIAPYRDWLARETSHFLAARPRLEEETRETTLQSAGPIARVPLIVTALVIFALYLMSFNLYITSTGEEREKRVLLGLLLSPASPVEFIVAKALFYASSSLFLSLAVVSMYQPRLLANPYLWLTVFSGSVGYIAIGTVVISLVRRQTTISTVSMLYLVATSVIMMLAQFLPLFIPLKLLLMENYLYSQLQQLVAGQDPWWLKYNQVAVLLSASAWSVVAVVLFAKQGMTIARAR